MFNIYNYLKILLCILFFVTLLPVRVSSAEVLQIKSSSIIQIGDQNRNYKVKIACINVDPNKEEEATIWLKSELPRKSKVNILPKGSENGILLAKLINLKSNKDISKLMVEFDFGDFSCEE